MRGSCESIDQVYAEDIDVTSRMAPAVPRLARGRYGFAASAFDALRVEVATGCVEVDIPTSTVIETVIRDGAPMLDGGTDSGLVDATVDAGIPEAADRCGEPETFVLSDTTRSLRVDTTTATGSSLTLVCAGSIASGYDRFYAIDAVAGDYWHFHLSADPAFAPLEPGRDPVLYVVAANSGGVCDDRLASCPSDFANACVGRADEHFAFIAPSNGRFYVGIDDANPGGGHYQLDAFRPSCGNGIQEHGESCDDPDPATCSRTCRKIIGTTARGDFPAEAEFNDDVREANEIAFAGVLSTEITGDIGGVGDCYPDVFQIRVETAGIGVRIDALTGTGGPCPSTSSAPYTLQLYDAAGTQRAGGVDAAGCPNVNAPSLPAGSYTLWVKAQDLFATAPAFYRLRITRE